METARPATAQEAACLIREAAARELPVVIEGAGTRRGWQPEPEARCLRLSTTGLETAAEVRTQNMTARFPAGISLAQVRAELAASGLWLPLEHLDSPHSTLGGCLAAGFTDPLRLGYGPARDWVLGLEVVTGEGQVLAGGGEVIKNVAGYDMVKIHLGAWGRLGVITSVTVRLLPRPEARATVVATGIADAGAVDEAVRVALGNLAAPAALEVAGDACGFRLLAALFGQGDWLRERTRLLAAELAAAGLEASVEEQARDEEVWGAYRAARAAYAGAHDWQAKCSVTLPGFASLVGAVEAAAGAAHAQADDQDWALSGHAGSGVFTVYWSDARGPLPFLDGLARSPACGYLVAEAFAARALAGHERWVSFPPREPRAQDALEARVVDALTRGRAFNPHLPGIVSPGAGAGRG